MKTYTVLAPKPRKGAVAPDRADCVFVKEGFSWPAFLFAPLWLLWQRMWLVLILFVLAAIGAGILTDLLPAALSGVPGFLLALLFGFEANNLRRWTLERRGWRLEGLASGGSLGEAELRYYMRDAREAAALGASADTTPGPFPAHAAPAVPPVPRPALPSMAFHRPTPADAGGIVGLFPRPGGGVP